MDEAMPTSEVLRWIEVMGTLAFILFAAVVILCYLVLAFRETHALHQRLRTQATEARWERDRVLAEVRKLPNFPAELHVYSSADEHIEALEAYRRRLGDNG